MSINRKASLFGSPLILFLSFALILVLIIMFFALIDFKKDNTFTIEDVESDVGDSLFLIGMLKSQVNGENIPLSQVLAKYDIEDRDEYESIIRNHINKQMLEMYKKDICWELTVSEKEIEDDNSGCQKLSKEDYILASTKIPGFYGHVFEVRFETR